MSFDDFWKVYPRPVAKSYARSVYTDITNGGKWVHRKDTGEKWFVQGTEEQIDAAAVLYAKKVARDGTMERHIPHPSTWLHEGRFEDDYGEEQPTQRQMRLRNFLERGYWKDGDADYGPRPTVEQARAELGGNVIAFRKEVG